MKGTRKASYIGQLSSGYDATVQDDYNAGQGDKGQIGKGHEEEVAPKDNWTGDKRDAVGKAASAQLRRTAAKLIKYADMLDGECECNLNDDDDNLEGEENFDESNIDDLADDVDGNDEISDEEYEDLVGDVIASSTGTEKSAAHPLDHDEKKDDPKANMSSQTGDDEWIDIGDANFNDKRDEAGRAE